MSEPKMSAKTNTGYDRILYEQGMRNCFEDHIKWLTENSELHVVDKVDAYRFHYDFSAYLMEKGIEPGLHWLYMRINNYKYNWEFTQDTQFLLVPRLQDIETLIGLHNDISR